MTQGNDEEDFGKLLAEFERETGNKNPKKPMRGPQPGDLVRARVVSIGHDTVFVALSGKTEGMIDLLELRDDTGKPTVKVGDEVEARVVEAGGAGVRLRVHGMGKGPQAKAELEQAAELGIPVEGTVTGVNKGGVEVLVAGVRGFCPISQLDRHHVADAAAFVGQKLEFKVTKYDVSGRFADLVLSRRALLEEEQRRKAEVTRAKLAPGAVMSGTVSSIKDYGAFVDLGGIEGLIHVSELGFSRVDKPSDVLAVGQPVEVVVLKIQPAEGKGPERISLSLKALEKDPWADLAERYPVGTRVVGKVVRVEQFGAFVELLPGVEGLLHVSELAPGGQVRHARERAKVGDAFEVIIESIDAERRRVSLGLASKIDAVSVDSEGAARAKAPKTLGTLGDLLAKAQAGKQDKSQDKSKKTK